MRITSSLLVTVLAGALSASAGAEPLRCDLTSAQAGSGAECGSRDNLLTVSWRGDGNQELRLRFTIAEGRPVIRDLASGRGPAPGPRSARA
jgi:hypothetical protein